MGVLFVVYKLQINLSWEVNVSLTKADHSL